MSEFQTVNNTVADDEIDLVEIFYLLWNNFFKIILCFLIGAVLAFAYSFFLVTPLYQSTSKMYINSSTKSVVDMADLQISSNLRSDYKALITSRQLLENVISNLRLDYEPDDLSRMISVGNPTDTRIITVTVTSPSPQEAANIANELANRAKVYLPEIMKSEEPVVYESALVPTRKSSPSYSRNTMIGGLIGAVLMSAYLIIKHLMNDTIVTPDDAQKYLGVQPLAVIPEGNLGDFNKRRRKSSKSAAKKKGK